MQKLVFILVMITSQGLAQKPYRSIGTVRRYDSAVNRILSPDARAEIIAEGMDWSEGALWVEAKKMLLFSDVPANLIYKWTAAKGKEVYLTPSGYTGTAKRGGEMGSNGLLLDRQGRLVLCQHGDRRMARMNAALDHPRPIFTALATGYGGKQFNSPNDAVMDSRGNLYFTDPPYGLPTQSDRDPGKQIPFNGVYELKKTGELVLLVDSLTRPNGIAFFPGEKKLLIANSDPLKPYWYVFDVGDGHLFNGKIFYSAAGYDKELKGLPDGLKIDRKGNVFAAGPGGIHIFNGNGKLLGKLELPDATSNCSLSSDEKTLYITNDKYVLRFIMRK